MGMAENMDSASLTSAARRRVRQVLREDLRRHAEGFPYGLLLAMPAIPAEGRLVQQLIAEIGREHPEFLARESDQELRERLQAERIGGASGDDRGLAAAALTRLKMEGIQAYLVRLLARGLKALGPAASSLTVADTPLEESLRLLRSLPPTTLRTALETALVCDPNAR
jgi:hypothetical protein